MSRVFQAMLAVSIGMLVLAGCDGSSKDSQSPMPAGAEKTTASAPTSTNVPIAPHTIKIAKGKPLSRAEWIAKGDAICARINTLTASSTIKSTSDIALVLPQVALYDKTEASELSKLVPPSSRAHDWQQIVEGLQLFGEYATRFAEYARVNNTQAAKPLLIQGEATHKRVIAIAKRNGFKDCSIL